METKVNYTLVGLFVIVLSVGAVFAGYWLTASHRAKNYTPYKIVMDESVSGLSEQSPVRFNGVTVGYVSQIHLNTQNPKQVLLTVQIEDAVPITTSTYATLMSQGITGIAYVGLTAKTAHAPPLLPMSDGAPPEIPSQPSLLVQLDTTLRDATSNIKLLSKAISQMFNPKARMQLQATLQHLSEVTQTLADDRQDISKSVKNLSHILKDVAKASDKFPAIALSTQHTLQSVTKLSEAARSTLKASEATIQMASTQVLPEADEALFQVSKSAKAIAQLTQSLNQNPALLVRGRTPLPRGPGE